MGGDARNTPTQTQNFQPKIITMKNKPLIIVFGILVVSLLIVISPRPKPTVVTRAEVPILIASQKVASQNYRPPIVPKSHLPSTNLDQSNPPPSEFHLNFSKQQNELRLSAKCRNFIELSNAKDTVAGQAIARLLLENGYSAEYIVPVYNAARWFNDTNDSTFHIYDAKAGNGQGQRKRSAKILLRTMLVRTTGGTSTSLPELDDAFLDVLFENKPTVRFMPENAIAYGYMRPADGKYSTPQDILDYINAHPAKSDPTNQ
jgi:hypothetical protein